MKNNKLNTKMIVISICLILIFISTIFLIKLFIKNNNDNNEISNYEITQAKQILYNKFGENKEEYVDGVKYTYSYSYNFIDKYTDKNFKKYYVFDIKWSSEEGHLSSIGYYAVSMEDNDYYFVNNDDFKETGIIEIEPKVINDTYTIYKTGYYNNQEVLAKEFILDEKGNLYAILNKYYTEFNGLDLTEEIIEGTKLNGYFIMRNVKKVISVDFGNAGFTHEFIILNDNKVYSLLNGVLEGKSFIITPIPNLYDIKDINFEYDEDEDVIRYFAVKSDNTLYEIPLQEISIYFSN